MDVTIYCTPGIDKQQLKSMLKRAGDKVIAFSPAFLKDSGVRILVAEESFLQSDDLQNAQHPSGVLVLLKHEREIRRIEFGEDVPVEYCIGEITPIKFQNLVRTAVYKHQVQSMSAERDAYFRRVKELNNIGVALSTERDPDKLLEMILRKSREITSADAGSLYLVEGEEENQKQLRFKISQNDTMEVNYEEFLMPMTKGSIAGFVAITGETLNIPDVYLINSDQEYKFNRNFDVSTGYRTTSTLAIPMNNHKGEIIGIIQLINRKRHFATKLSANNYMDEVQAFDQNDEDLVSSLASQAAVALENNILIKSIQKLFEGFVTAAVTAIESRDPTTSGHSFRVADLTVGLAELVDKASTGRFSKVRFTHDEVKEMRYASLLHDFGKVGVRENVLVKAKKLYPMQMDLIKERFKFLKTAWEAEFYKSKLNLLLQQGKEGFEAQLKDIEAVFNNRMNSLHDYLQFINQSNEPTVLAEGNFERLLRIASDTELLPPGMDGPMLMPEEVQLLSIRKGSLNDRERIEIESHVTHTFSFLSKIPWTSELRRVPIIAYGHHEKLNGRGYPNRLQADDIPIQTRMMTISDIFDALTASDRPYKKAVPYEKALDIIASEVKADQIDPELFQLFVDGKIFQLTTGK